MVTEQEYVEPSESMKALRLKADGKMFNGWKITNILDVGLCELDTADGPTTRPDTGLSIERTDLQSRSA